VRLTGGLVVGQPVGAFAAAEGPAVGWELAARVPLDGTDRVALRVFLGDLLYGWKREKLCGSAWNSCSWPEAWTTNSVSFGGIGPEVSFDVGPFRPYLAGFVGFGLFGTTESVRGWWFDTEAEERDLLSHAAFSGGVGAGFDLELRGGESPVVLNMGVQYHRHGMVRYLTGGDVVHDPDGTVSLFPRLGPANLLSWRIGLTLALPRPGKE
jgi:hypothetical protein